ncbi:hypothetical protein N7523_003481 [Penicillium sp. IBT 18751x]|nr:hypothetical protein N7523_003481 [Penicillium sp. IBT 18751x]
MSGEPGTPPSFTSAERIRQLNEIDQDVAKLIHSAGLAIQALTNAKPNSTSSEVPEGSLESHKTQFKDATQQYFALLSSIDVRLRRQVYALEESSVLAPDPIGRAGDVSTGTAGAAGSVASNSLDISWLNSRKDTVGKDKEAELWAAARGFVEQLNKSTGEPNDSSKLNGDSEMKMD